LKKLMKNGVVLVGGGKGKTDGGRRDGRTEREREHGTEREDGRGRTVERKRG
jgi:hypothetical protein